MKSRYIISIILIFFLPLAGCSFFSKKPTSHPYENLLTIMADCQRALGADIYRFAYPVDATGQNIYKSSLVRLANYEKLYPGKFTEPLTFMRARLYERLGDYSQAGHYYGTVAAMKGELAELAESRLPIADNFNTITGHIIRARTAEEYQRESELKMESLRTLIEKCAGLDAEPLARVELEKAEVDYAVFLQDNRHLLRDGTRLAVEKWKEIISSHSESKNLPSHRIHLADFYYSLAKEYVTWVPPERIGFEWKVFENFAIQARDIYYEVSQMDGYPEKREGRAKLDAILAFIETTRKRSQ